MLFFKNLHISYHLELSHFRLWLWIKPGEHQEKAHRVQNVLTARLKTTESLFLSGSVAVLQLFRTSKKQRCINRVSLAWNGLQG